MTDENKPTKVDIVVAKDKFVQNDKYNTRLCDIHTDLIKKEYDNVELESTMTQDEIKDNRAKINELLIPGRGYTKFTLRLMRQGINYTHTELVKLNTDTPIKPEEPDEFALYVYNHGYYAIAKEVNARVTVPFNALKTKGASTKEKLTFLTNAYANFDKFRYIMQILYIHVDAYNAKKLEKEDMHIHLFNRIKNIFYEEVFKNIEKDLCEMVIDRVIAHNNGEPLDIDVIANVINMYRTIGCPDFDPVEDEHQINMHIYRNFEKTFIQHYEAYYKKEAAARISANGYDGYVAWVDSVLTSAAKTTNDIKFGEYGQQDMQTILVNAIVEPYYNNMITDSTHGMYNMVVRNDKDNMTRLYLCMDKLPKEEDPYFNDLYNCTYKYDGLAISKMSDEMCRFINSELADVTLQFENTVSDEKYTNERMLISVIADIDAKYNTIITECFKGVNTESKGSAIFYENKKKIFVATINKTYGRKDKKPNSEDVEIKQTTLTDMISSFLNMVMCDEIKELSDDQSITNMLDKIFNVFMYINDKDVFQEQYKNYLARRILFKQSKSDDNEKYFLGKLKSEMGISYVYRLEGMFADNEMSATLVTRFNDTYMNKQFNPESGKKLDFDVRVLTQVNWPMYATDTLVPPPEINAYFEAFTRYYKMTYATKKLDWISSNGSGAIDCNFSKGRKEITGSIYQLAIISTIDRSPTNGTMSVADLATKLNLPASTVKLYISSMYLSKFPILMLCDAKRTKIPTKKTIDDSDIFGLDVNGFQSPLRKFKLPNPSLRQKIDATSTPSQMDEKRGITIEAALVRVMKSHKTLPFQELQSNVIALLSKYFTPQPKMIKARTEALIEREYMRRSDADPSVLEYIA